MSGLRKNDTVFYAGHKDLVGGAILAELKSSGYQQIITRTRAELDLMNRADVSRFFEVERLDVVFIAEAKIAGIHANTSNRADFISENLNFTPLIDGLRATL